MGDESSFTRRSMIAASGATLAGAAAATSAQAQAPTLSKTFVLIHGAWHGGWCWRRVADQLEGKGHKVFTPTLTGLGERSHLLTKDVNLDTHIADIVNVFRWEDLKNVCLVVHSYGGWPGSGALEHINDRVSSVVFLDAFLPENGERSYDTASDFSRKGTDEAIAKGEIGRKAPPASAFHVNEKDRAWVESKLTPQPTALAMATIKLTGARDKVAKKTYIRAPVYPQPAFDKYFAAKKADPAWWTFVAEGGHDVMVDQPQWLVERLLEVS
jgi:pimeloyl-ACP methyl ester carboxylesterase